MVPAGEDPIPKEVNLAYLLLSYFLKFSFNITITFTHTCPVGTYLIPYVMYVLCPS